MTTTTRLGLPLLAAGQLGKELTHNEALARLDGLVAPAVLSVGANSAPPSPMVGDCHIIGSAPTGPWSGQGGALANFTDGGWRFCAPTAGLRAMVVASGEDAVFDGSQWQVGNVRATQMTVGGNRVVAERQPPIADHPSDPTVNAILGALRAHGLIAP